MTNLTDLPADLPVPVDDGAADHLLRMKVPAITLRSTSNRLVNLVDVSNVQTTVVYCYPMTGVPGNELPSGWNQIPGARGCTPQACAYRDHFCALQSLGVRVFGLSIQSTEYQSEMAARLELQFEVLSDEDLLFTKALNLPTFQVESKTLIKRITLVISRAEIVKVFYPVFPADQNAEEVIQWFRETEKRDLVK